MQYFEKLIVEAFSNKDYILLEKISKNAIRECGDFSLFYKALGIALNGQNRVLEALDIMRQTVTLFPEDYEGYLNLAKALNQNGYYEETKELLLNKDLNVDGLNELGKALLKLENFEEAINYLQISYKIDNKNIQTAILLSDCYLFLEPQKSINLLKDVINLAPNSPIIYNKLATAYMQNRELLNSIEYHKFAIDKLLLNPIEIKNLPKVNKINISTLYETLTLLNKNSIKAFACSGTLLGLHRDGKLLENDKDIDIGIFIEDLEDTIKILSQNGYKEYLKSYGLINPRAFIHKESQTVIDICCYKKVDNGYITGLWMDGVNFEDNRITFYEDRELELVWCGEFLEIANKSDYLSRLYGDWEIKNSDFDTIINAPNIIDFSPLVEIFGLDKIYSSILTKNFKKAKNLCLHIFNKSKNRFYIDLKDKIQSLEIIKQPTKTFFVNFTLPNSYDISLAKEWLNQIFYINLKDYKSEVEAIANYGLVFTNRLLQAINIPTFYSGFVKEIIHERNSSYKAVIELAFIDNINEQCYFGAINTAFDSVLIMSQNSLTEKNIKLLHNTIIDKAVINLSKMVPHGKSTIPILYEVYKKNIPFFHLGGGVYHVGLCSKSKKLQKSTTDRDSAIGSNLSQNKFLTANIIRLAGLPAPTHYLIDNKDNLKNIADSLGYPLVVKPVDLDRGEGVYTDIYNFAELELAFNRAYQISKQLLIEKQVAGVCHRLLVAHGELLYGVRRDPISIYGDGFSTISDLIVKANLAEELKPIWLRNVKYPNDELAQSCIAKYGYTLKNVPNSGEVIPLRPIETTAWGETTIDVTDLIHSDNRALAIKVAKLFELDVVGVDIITEDISKAWYKNGAIINEINFSPLLGGSKPSLKAIPKFIDNIGIVPIEVFIGGYDLAKNRHKELCLQNIKCYLTTHNHTISNMQTEYILNGNSLYSRLISLFLDKEIDMIIIVVENNEFLNTKFPINSISALTVCEKNNDLVDYKKLQTIFKELL